MIGSQRPALARLAWLILRPRRIVAGACIALIVFGVFSHSNAIGSRRDVPRKATVAIVTTKEFRVAVVAMRLSGAPPTADLRVGLARRAGGRWREVVEHHLGERYFWNTVSDRHAVCRLEIVTAGTRHSPRSRVIVQLLLSPSLGCGRIYRIPLPS
jgi:hypothetical protein